ncbi:MAG: GspH/FimT family pseudopilin [Nitrospiraceae bacterium]
MQNWRTNSTSPARPSEAGFTLTEAMTVVAIVALGVTIAAPNFLAANARHELKQAVTELHSNLNVARMAAMSRNRTVTVTLTGGGGPAVTASINDSAGGQVIPNQVMVDSIESRGGASTVQFNSLGLRTGGGTANQTITLTNSEGLTYAVEITPAGKTRWCPAAAC